MRRISTAGVLFAALAVLFAGSVQAAPFTFVDAAGDSVDRRASMDIVAVKYDVRQVDDAGPLTLVVEMKLAAPPEGRLVYYTAAVQSDDCGYVLTTYVPGTAYVALGSAPAYFRTGCGSPPNVVDGSTETFLRAEFRIDGNTLRWSIPLAKLPKELRGGSTFNELGAATRIVEPVNGFLTGLLIDQASTDQSWSY